MKQHKNSLAQTKQEQASKQDAKMSYKEKLVQAELDSKLEFKSLESKPETSKVMWLVWKSSRWLDSRLFVILLEAVSTPAGETLLLMYSPSTDNFLVAYAPLRYAGILKELEQGSWLQISISAEGVVSIEYAEPSLSPDDVAQALQDFTTELKKAYESRPDTWRKVWDAWQKKAELWSKEDELQF